MATTDGAIQASAPGRKSGLEGLLGRDRLARLVVVSSFLTMFLLVSAVLGLAQSSSSASTAAKDVFNSILPVLAGWVGTVLAFYFSAASQELTSASLNQALGRNADREADKALVSEKMLPLSKIEGLQDLNRQAPNQITLATLWELFYNTRLPNGGRISRVMFVDRDIFKYVLHVGPFNAFLLKQSHSGTAPAAAGAGAQTPGTASAASSSAASTAGSPPATSSATGRVNPPAWVGTLTFADMLLEPELVEQISKLVVFVSAAATLRDTKAELDKVSGAQDVIVTPTGNATESMLGWLPNVELTKVLQVS